MLRIWDVFSSSEFFNPGSRVKKGPDPQQRIYVPVILTLKLFPVLSCWKYDLDCLSQIWIFFHPGYGIPDPGVKKAPYPGSGSASLVQNTVFPGSGSGSGYTGCPAPGRHLRGPRLLCGQGRDSELCFPCSGSGSRVSDPYSFFTDPDPDPEDPDGGQYGSKKKKN